VNLLQDSLNELKSILTAGTTEFEPGEIVNVSFSLSNIYLLDKYTSYIKIGSIEYRDLHKLIY